jgi:ABC-2 type transport system permease protein
MILLSGFASPVDNMPGWLQVIAEADPLKHFMVVSEGIFLKGLPASGVWANTWPLLVIAALTTSASAALFRSRLE